MLAPALTRSEYNLSQFSGKSIDQWSDDAQKSHQSRDSTSVAAFEAGSSHYTVTCTSKKALETGRVEFHATEHRGQKWKIGRGVPS
jgi:hypothetical protein